MYIVKLKTEDGTDIAICKNEDDLSALTSNLDYSIYKILSVKIVEGQNYKEFLKKEDNLEIG